MNINIYQISSFLSKQQVLALGLFNDKKSKKTTKYLSFYLKIVSNEINSDDEAIEKLKYRKKSSFLKFKERYTKKLLDYLLLSQSGITSNNSSYDLYFKLLGLYAVARVLQLKNQTKNAVNLYEYINQKSEKPEFLDLLLFTTTFLKQHYAYIEPNKKLFQYYSEKIKACEHNLIRINYINKHYDEISHNNIVLEKTAEFDDFKKSTLETSNKLYKEIAEDDTYQFKNKVFEIQAYALNINEKFQESIEVSKKSIELSENHFDVVTEKTLNAYRDILAAHLRLNDFDNAQIYLSKILYLSKSINHNHFRYRSLEFTLYACTFQYNKLYELTTDILSLKKLCEFKVHQEEWNIRQAFVNILVEAGKINPDIQQRSIQKFKLNRFINEVEFYSKDKRGTNISVLVIQLLHFLIRKQYDKIIDRLDALNQYTFRYLKNDETLRSNCFIKMLLKLPEAEYHPLRTERYVTKYKKKLLENPYEVSMKEIAIEIIPYEQLWDITIEILNKNLGKNASHS